jgi:hypothetical protein
MTITLNDTPGTSISASGANSFEFKSTEKPPAEGPSFGQLMTDLWPSPIASVSAKTDTQAHALDPVGQAFADGFALALSPLPGPETPALTAFSLGPHLSVITAQTPAPDAQSLESFARSQGLDEQAVHWLFGASPSANSPIALNLNKPWQEITSPAKGLNTPMGEPGLSEDCIQLNLFRMPPPAAVWVQRNGLSPLQHNPSPSDPGPKVIVSELDLGADWAAELFAAAPVAEGAAPNGASTTGTQGTAYANFATRWDALAATSNDSSQAAVATTPENTSRAETIQNLADKMGYAIGQRILSEMEKGQWHLKLQLRPVTLGHIEVEMRLRSGEFDAVFTAPHQLTRDLLQDGMSRLKETLSQMGMDVAWIHVQDGQSGQRGGESTPGGTLAGKAKEEPESKETQTDPTLAQQVKNPSDGLDILV